MHDSEVLRKLFDEIAPRYVDRPGGYTRIMRLGTVRVGDAAQKAILELLKKDEEGRKKKKTPRKTYHKIEMPAAPGVKEKPREGRRKPLPRAPRRRRPPKRAAPARKAPAPSRRPRRPRPPTRRSRKPHKAEGEKKAKAKAGRTKPKGKKE